MNCEHCQIELEDYLYGELSERLAGEIREHLSDCAECQALRNELERENELFAQFYEQTAIDPSAETWQAIRSRIEANPAQEILPEEKPGWRQSLLGILLAPGMIRQAALALLLVAVSVAGTLFFMRSRENSQKLATVQTVTATPSPTIEVTPSPVPAPSTDVANAGAEKPSAPSSKRLEKTAPAKPLSDQELLARQLCRAEREYKSAIKLLDRAVAKRRDSIDPLVFKQYENSLALIDNSILQSKRALREQPVDLAAGQFLLAAYAKKVELMQDMAMQ